ncbi:MAG: hypothetical protein F6K54_12745 [Okeania sp. SIO3B5]|uniref:hypothetical protein n=1 Tax=Okeania sp. SIO3B5 TaxID=2607811 RepID=UPI001400EA6E|nr:hypothetical protein [Okeania sp. SIO3B5]NEO53870.1 hypothetical protein [Okeania sp. SIO3B5]
MVHYFFANPYGAIATRYDKRLVYGGSWRSPIHLLRFIQLKIISSIDDSLCYFSLNIYRCHQLLTLSIQLKDTISLQRL